MGSWRVRKSAIGLFPTKAQEACMFKVKILPALCLATGIAWAAESPFIGEWKLDPSKTRMPDEMKVESKGGNKYAFDFGGGRRDDRRGWDRPTGLRRHPAVGESRSARHLDRRAQERWPVADQGDLEALEGRQHAHGLFPRVRVRRLDAQYGLRLPAHRLEDRASRQTGRASRRR